ncbi:MAG: outer membrane lipid asymmetry maintenance protein MlaD [Legionellales bacterium]|nr:MAG: outer membrane lipid asymmetry maintenance protein MlaD [Legionellales bacterium]
MEKDGSKLEVLVGSFMLLALIALLFLALQVSGLNINTVFIRNDYEITAGFNNVGSLKVRAPVSIAGVEIGKVVSIHLDPEDYRAIVVMKMHSNIKLPVDSSVKIASQGLLGTNYMDVSPGYSEKYMRGHSSFSTTYSATSLQSLINTFLSSSSSAGGKKHAK